MCVVFDGSSDKYSNLLLALIRKAQAYGVPVGYTYDANCLRMNEKKFIIREVHIFGFSDESMQPEEAAIHLSEMCTRYQAHQRALRVWRERGPQVVHAQRSKRGIHAADHQCFADRDRYDQTRDRYRRIRSARAARGHADHWYWGSHEQLVVRCDCQQKIIERLRRERDEAQHALALFVTDHYKSKK